MHSARQPIAYQHNPVRTLSAATLTLLAVSACRCGGANSSQSGPAVSRSTRAFEQPKTEGSNDSSPADPWVPGDPGATDLRFDINPQLQPRPISPLIYGINSDLRDFREQRWGVIRAGGNRATAYNWENNASNAGSDYLFQNDGLASQSDAPAEPLLKLIDAAASISAAVIMTISNADYVAADKNGGGDVRRSGADYLRTRFKANHPRKGSAFAALPDPSDAHVYQDEFVAFLKAQRPNTKLVLSMDNEPELWSQTHAEIFRSAVTYADLWRRNHAYARAAKDVWPGIEVLGFVSFGYSGYIDLQKARDADGRSFIDWYLDQARAAERAEGSRLIDYLDLHWYPEAQGGGERVTGTNTASAVVSAREQAPRSLWDPSYSETSWIRDKHGGPIDLLHWLQAKIARHYPGTKLAFTEWNYGAGNHISGAIAVADVLGIFGKYGVSLASYWPLIDAEPYAYAAFRAYRNYDGQGSGFGDTSVAAISSDVEAATVYASIQSDHPERLVIVAINKDTTMKHAGFRISYGTAYTKAAMFVLTGAQPVLTQANALRAVAMNAFRYEMPAQSICVVIPQQ